LAMELAESYRLTEMTALLRGYLDSEDPTTRKLAVYFLSFQDREEDLVPVLIGLLDNETSRGGAMRTLAAWRVVEAAEPVELFLEDGRERIRIAAANALRDLGQARSAPALIRALGDPVFTVRHAAARALVVLGEDALPVIDAALDPADPRTRQILMQILEDIHTPAALERRQSFDPVFPSEPIQVEQGYYRRPQ
ncbi:MAG: HEAT repeat domain-containing protein, partial [Kiritimatiellae bacterium]|nr:HEAT repeat domain-containing protein [Kiritimatiellia bacterium]